MLSRKTLAGAVVLATLLATVGIAGAVVTNSSPAQTTPSDGGASMSNTITVGASGQVQAEADRAVIEVAVVATGDEIADVRERLTDNVSQMRAALSERGINGSQIRTRNYDISTERRYGGPRESEGPTYRAVHAFSITVNDTGNVGEIIDTAVTSGADEVDGVRFTLSADKRERLREQALKQAMSSARSEAGAIASESDLTVVGVDRVTTTEYSGRPYSVEGVALAASGDGGTSIDSGPVSVSASVTVVYNVE